MTFKKWLITLMLLLLVADAAILLDIPVLRQVLGFLCFTTIPGLLILYNLKLWELSFLRKFLLSVGLSLSFLIFIGLLINTLLPWFGYSKPLSTSSLIISLSLVIAILGFIAYWRNRRSIQFAFSPEIGNIVKNKCLSLLLFPILFPLLTIIGRKVMDTGGSNLILIATFLLIPFYVVLLMWQSKNVPKMTYPLAIGMISLSLLLAQGLISNYLGGGDIYSEYHAFQEVSTSLQWNPITKPGSLTASLSLSLLPVVFQSILKINPVYMYKVVFLLLISLTPVIGYVIYEKYVGHLYGFLSSFFFMAQIPFIYLLSGQIRVGIALISLALAVMVLFDDHVTGLNRRILFLIFLFSLVVEYYVLPVIFLGLLFVLWLVPKIWKGDFSHQTISMISAIALPSVLIYFWWGQLTATAFSSYVFFGKQIIVNLSKLFIEEFRSGMVTTLYTIPEASLAMRVPGIVQRVTFVVIGIGVVFMWIRKEQRIRFSNYAILMSTCLVLLASQIILPFSSFGYGPDRLYIQLLVLLAPAFIVGCQAISFAINVVWTHSLKFVRFKVRDYRPKSMPPRLNLAAILIGVLVVSQFFSSSFLYHQLLDFPVEVKREILDAKSTTRLIVYVYDSEVVAAQWLQANNIENLPVYIGNMLQPQSGNLFEYTDCCVDRKFDVLTLEQQIQDRSYLFLGHLNVVDGQVNITIPWQSGLYKTERGPLADYAHLLADKSRIYANGSAEVYR